MRVAASLDELGSIGGSPDGGVTRLAWTPELFAAYDWVGERMRALGLTVEVDAAGNLIGRWEVGEGDAVLVGSHLDTVPSGGRLDGALGVVGGVHAVAELQRRGFTPRRPLWVVAFMDEEGTRFGAPHLGSRAFVGDDVSALGSRADEAGMTLADAMRAFDREFGRVGEAARIAGVHACLELHIEQGPVLEAAGKQIGVVTSIVGQRRFRIRLTGQANHAGTTPMSVRQDAFAGAARIAVELRDHARAGSDMVATVGAVSIVPGVVNIVPGSVEFTVDARAATAVAVAGLDRAIEEVVARVAGEEGLGHELEREFSVEPLELDPELVRAVSAAAAAEGAASLRLPSGAGHDALVLGRHVPAAMIFVPSTGGLSHSPAEHTPPDDLELGVRVLAATLEQVLS